MNNKIPMRVCAHDITVLFSDPGDWSGDGMGRCNEMDGTIYLRTGMPNSVQCATLLHELLHMVLGIHGLAKHNTEVLVSTLAASLLDILRNNPTVALALTNGASIEDLSNDDE